MNTADRLLLYWAVLVAVTAAVIALTYAEWGYLRFPEFSLMFQHFAKWPWLRVSALLATMTVFAAWGFCRNATPEKAEEYGVLWGVGFMPILFLFVYPGRDNFGLHSDGFLGLCIGFLGLTHGIAFWRIGRGLTRG